MTRLWLAAAVGLILVAFAAAPPSAQDAPPAIDVEADESLFTDTADEPPVLSEPDAPRIDYREEMRRFVERISDFARSNRRDFIVVAQGGLELLEKPVEEDSDEMAPATAYLLSLDGILVESLNFGIPGPDEPTPVKRRAELIRLARIADNFGVRVLVLDYGEKPDTVATSNRQSRGLGFVPFTAPEPGPANNRLAPSSRRPFFENPATVRSLTGIRNFAYLHAIPPSVREAAFTLDLHETNFDLLVVDLFIGREPLSKKAVETLKYKKLGTRRLVMARADIGTAARYRYYWQPQWNHVRPDWARSPLPDDPDRFHVAYWEKPWQEIIVGDTESFIYGILDQGFDGVVLDGIDAFLHFENEDSLAGVGY